MLRSGHLSEAKLKARIEVIERDESNDDEEEAKNKIEEENDEEYKEYIKYKDDHD